MFQRVPGYQLFRSLTQRLAGQEGDTAWKPALAEIEEALVPAFIIEELEDGRFTVFVPSVPTPLAGSIYILASGRVHPLNIPFTQAIKTDSSKHSCGTCFGVQEVANRGRWKLFLSVLPVPKVHFGSR